MQGSRAAQAFEAAAKHAEAEKHSELAELRRQLEADHLQDLKDASEKSPPIGEGADGSFPPGPREDSIEEESDEEPEPEEPGEPEHEPEHEPEAAAAAQSADLEDGP